MLLAHEPPAVLIERSHSPSPFLFTCDHASNRLPEGLDLGVSGAERERHIAWDIGALGVAQALAAHFDACLVATQYSRLVIDCNRHTWREDLIPPVSETTAIPGNVGLSEAARAARQRALYEPYHATIRDLLNARAKLQRATIYISVHSFTPTYKGNARPWQIALLSNRDRRIAEILLRELGRDPTLCVGDNTPYRLSDAGSYSVPVHAEQRGLPHVLIEIRQDQITDAVGQQQWVARLAPILSRAAQEIGVIPA